MRASTTRVRISHASRSRTRRVCAHSYACAHSHPRATNETALTSQHPLASTHEPASPPCECRMLRQRQRCKLPRPPHMLPRHTCKLPRPRHMRQPHYAAITRVPQATELRRLARPLPSREFSPRLDRLLERADGKGRQPPPARPEATRALVAAAVSSSLMGVAIGGGAKARGTASGVRRTLKSGAAAAPGAPRSLRVRESGGEALPHSMRAAGWRSGVLTPPQATGEESSKSPLRKSLPPRPAVVAAECT